MLLRIFIYFTLLIAFSSGEFAFNSALTFKLGNETLLDDLSSIKGKRIALITNQTGIDSRGFFFLDVLIERKINVVKIFSPEHGIRGNENYADIDASTGIPIVSIYGAKTAPAPEDLEDVDVLIYDIQDVGARFYTYTSTLNDCIGSAIANKIQMIVCDRPMIINANYVDGFMLDTLFKSFVGTIPVPICYGMTCGELALYLNKESFGNSGLIKVSKMEGYSRETQFVTLELPWMKPSPSMFTIWTASTYTATCFLEGTNVSEGRGTPKPFEYFGAPWIKSDELAEELNNYGLDGVNFNAVTFTPSQQISAYPPKFFNEECNGIYINVTDRTKFQPVKAGVAILVSLKKLYPEFQFNINYFIDKLAGTDRLRMMIENGDGMKQITDSWQNELKIFKEKRQKVLLYY
ncbi:MAG: DUF1343 domain-containing protein [Ignavibacteriae bacterium]|nr:MAG: DUF1343 domain-containing protein [Ignavibacteriota bacterium]